MFRLSRFNEHLALALGATVALAALAVPLPAHAATVATAPASPELIAQHPGSHGYYEYDLAAGQVQSGAIVVRNPSAGAAEFALDAVDGSTSAATGVIYSSTGVTPSAAGAWISLGAKSMALAAGQSRTVTFRVSVPANAVPGDHSGGISAQSLQTTAEHRTTSDSKSVGVALAVSTRLVIAVVVHVAGHAAPGLTLGPPGFRAENGNRQIVDVPMYVTGTVFIKPELTATLRPCNGGAQLARIDRQLDTMVPATAIDYQWSLGTLVLPAGCYTVSVTATLGGQARSQVRGNIAANIGDHVHPTAPGAFLPALHAPTHSQSSLALFGLGILIFALGAALGFAILKSRRRRRELENALVRLAAYDSARTT
jgi:hypothetical protein